MHDDLMALAEEMVEHEEELEKMERLRDRLSGNERDRVARACRQMRKYLDDSRWCLEQAQAWDFVADVKQDIENLPVEDEPQDRR